jgi:cytochrome c-type biogenesis protein CcmF
MGILAVCFWGVIFPLVSELFTGQKVTVGPPFYERATGPLWAGLLFLMGVAPLSAWGHSTLKTYGRALWKPTLVALVIFAAVIALGVRSPYALIGFFLSAFTFCITLYDYGRAVLARSKATGEGVLLSFWRLPARNRRRYGGYIIHLGVVLMALGVIGIEMFQVETQGTLAPGESLTVSGYTVTFRQLDEFDLNDRRNVARAIVDVTRGGQYLGQLFPRRDFYYDSQQPMTIPGVRSTMEDDLYVLLVDWQPMSNQGATFKVYHNPLVNWLWIGSLIFILGTCVAAWPDQEREPARRTAASPVVVRA